MEDQLNENAFINDVIELAKKYEFSFLIPIEDKDIKKLVVNLKKKQIKLK